ERPGQRGSRHQHLSMEPGPPSPRRPVRAPAAAALSLIADHSPREDLAMLFDLFRRPRTSPRLRRPSAPPRLEALEDRSLPSTFSVVNLNDAGAGSLRQPVRDANATAGPDTIRFDPGLHGTIPLTSGQLNVTDDVNVNGPGEDQVTVSGGHASRVFDISGAGTNVTIRDLTIADGRASGVTVTGPLGPATLGGGILNEQA